MIRRLLLVLSIPPIAFFLERIFSLTHIWSVRLVPRTASLRARVNIRTSFCSSLIFCWEIVFGRTLPRFDYKPVYNSGYSCQDHHHQLASDDSYLYVLSIVTDFLWKQ